MSPFWRGAVLAAILAGNLAAVAWVDPTGNARRREPATSESAASGSSFRMIAPEGVVDPTKLTAGTLVEYRFAAEHLDAYMELTCWCGCEEAFDHRSLADCFVRSDGRWEAHGAGCAVCLGEARFARERLAAGVDLTTINADIDRTFGPRAVRGDTQ